MFLATIAPSQRCLDLIGVSENEPLYKGIHMTSKAYLDEGVYAIGFGHRDRQLKEGSIWTRQDCIEAMREDAASACKQVRRAVNRDLTQGQIDALTDFVYQFGVGRFKKSTLLKVVNDGEYELVPRCLMEWVWSGSGNAKRSMEALQVRRRRELSLWDAGDWS
jgi:lysozyme